MVCIINLAIKAAKKGRILTQVMLHQSSHHSRFAVHHIPLG